MIDIEAGTPCTELDLARIEQRLGRTLPEEFRHFALTFGNAFVGGTLDGNEEFEILDFMKMSEIGDHKGDVFNEYLDVSALPFASCSLGGIYVIKGDGTIWYLLNYSGNRIAREVAPSFRDFLGRIVIEE